VIHGAGFFNLYHARIVKVKFQLTSPSDGTAEALRKLNRNGVMSIGKSEEHSSA
jgi:hypothetical protein